MSSSRAKLPGVGVLRSRLNYDDSKSERYKTFQEDCRLFIRRFTTTSGVPGTQLHDRWSQEHIDGMKEMVDAFLNKNNSGNEYWPSERSHPNYNELVYRDQPNTITKRVRQLFFKINQQAISNMRYKSKHGIQSNTGRPDTEQIPSPGAKPAPGSTIHDPIDLESEPYQFTASNGRFPLIINHAPNDFRLSVGRLGDTVNVKTGMPAPSSQATRSPPRASYTSASQAEDVYTVPDDTKIPVRNWTPRERLHLPVADAKRSEGRARPAKQHGKMERPGTEIRKKRARTEDTHLPSKKPRTSDPVRRRSEPQAEQQPQRKSTRVKLQRYQSLYFEEQSPTESSESNSESDIGTEATRTGLAIPPAVSAPISSTQSTQSSEPSSSLPRQTSYDSGLLIQKLPPQATSQPPWTPERPPPPKLTIPPRPIAEQTKPAVPKLAALDTLQSRDSTSEAASMTEPTITNQKHTGSHDEPLAIVVQDPTTTSVSAGPFTMAIAPGVVEESYTSIQQNQIPGANGQSLSQGSQDTLRVPEAPMDASGARTAADSRGSGRRSPSPPELGAHEYAKAVYNQILNTKASHATANADAHDKKQTQPAPVHSKPALPQANAVDSSSQGEKKESTETTKFPSTPRSSASMMRQPTATEHAVRLVVISRRPTVSRSVWTPTVPLQKKTFQQFKDEIPLQLSSDFLGFKFRFVGPEERTVWEVQDGNEYEFQHMKLDMYEAIEEWKEEIQGSDVEMVFQLRIEELRNTIGKYKEADEA
ncbi:hypothetical protein NLG97_g2484 [Lecanicillium saksenae]|uniref:Uncharacterized protein n=1 Tax=Lecanicillium saksenae TaxID=468837 RepID=A0ACC1R2J0_9HYPO|nr:hypothetical protein NLG97_g2484 [Lecanicillium saksenae]